MRITKQQLIDFLDEYDEEDYEVRLTDEDGSTSTIKALEWANGPWIILDKYIATQDEIDVISAVEWGTP